MSEELFCPKCDGKNFLAPGYIQAVFAGRLQIIGKTIMFKMEKPITVFSEVYTKTFTCSACGWECKQPTS